jgi:hypothetical protein
MRSNLPTGLLSLLLACGALPAWCQTGGTAFQGPSAWTPAGSLASPRGWTTTAIGMNARMAWSESARFTSPAPWHMVTDLKPLSLGSIPPGSADVGPGQGLSPKPSFTP